jgi:subtilase family serine protease
MFKRLFTLALAGAAIISVTACSGASSTPVTPTGTQQTPRNGVQSIAQSDGITARHICDDPTPLHVNCQVILFSRSAQAAISYATKPIIYGYGPADLQKAYKLDPSKGAGNLVALVDTFSDPSLEADLAVYRKQFGLPACTIAKGCLKIINETGGTTLPAANADYATDEALGVDMVSANCPLCHMVMVEASTTSFSDTEAAENEAASLKPYAISNAYAGGEDNDPTLEAAYNNHPNIAVVASAGDWGYLGAAFPGSYPNVIAVGGTVLSTASNARGFTETVWGEYPSPGAAWQGSGSGCSIYYAKPSWQRDTGCPNRMMNDVAYSAWIPGVAFYDSYGQTGWSTSGGTSVGAPAISAIIALKGKRISNASGIYTNTKDLFDVTSGTNSTNGCALLYFCTGEVGYDGPTGNGTPNGDSAF